MLFHEIGVLNVGAVLIAISFIAFPFSLVYTFTFFVVVYSTDKHFSQGLWHRGVPKIRLMRGQRSARPC